MRGALVFSHWLYGALLRLYPRPFQAAYGRHMRLTFGDACRAAYQRGGVGGLLALWLATLFDLFKSALAERTRPGELTMSKTRLIAWAGPLTIVVGALWLLSALGQLAFQTGLVQNEGLLGLVILPVFLSVVPQVFAVWGTRLRFLPSAGGLARFGLALSLAGCVGWIVSVLGLILLGLTTTEIGPWGWVSYAPLVSVLSIRFGYLLFGVETLRARLLPRWNALPLLVGLTVVLSLPMEWFGAPALLPTQWASPFLHFALTGACWVLLGLALLDPSRAPQPAAAL